MKNQSLETSIREGEPPLAVRPAAPLAVPRKHRRLRLLAIVGCGVFGLLAVLTLIFYPYWSPYWNGLCSVRSFEMGYNTYSHMNMDPYRSFVVRSEQELDKAMADLRVSFMLMRGETAPDVYWLERCRQLEKRLRDARVDFDKEAVVFLLTSGYSSSTDVWLSQPNLTERRLSYTIRTGGSHVLRDHVCRGFVVIVQKDAVAEVELWEGGKQKEIVRVAPGK